MNKKSLIIAFLGLLLAVPSHAAGEIVLDSLCSKTMSAKVYFNVYLPDGYQKDSEHLPLTFLLHGLHGTHNDWPTHLKPVADELIASGEASRMIIVMPNAGGADVWHIQNGYFNMPGRSYEDFFFTELLPYVEKAYNCGGDKYQRAIMGLSMGGGGSTVYCQRHPEVFSSCYAMSPWLDNDSNEIGGERTEKDCFTITSDSVREHSAIKFVRNADEKTLEQLRTVKWFFDCGDDDPLLGQSILMFQEMKKKNVNREFRVRNGAHTWEYWHTALRFSLPFASRNFR